MTTGQSIARKLLDDEQWQREGLINWVALAERVDAAIEEEREACAKILDEEEGALNGLGVDEEARGNSDRAQSAYVSARQVKRIVKRLRARSRLPPIVD